MPKFFPAPTAPFTGFKSKARAHPNALQTFADGVAAILVLDIEDYDVNSEFDIGAYKFTAKVSGYYLVRGSVMFAAGVDQRSLVIAIKKDGGDPPIAVYQNEFSSVAAQNVTVTDIVYLAAGNYVQLEVTQNTGGNLDTQPLGFFTYMAVHRLS